MIHRRDLLQGGVALLTTSASFRSRRDEPSVLTDIFDGTTGERVKIDVLRKSMAAANVVFIGEQHDDPLTHRVERQLLEEASRLHGARLTLAMEMFERDQQAVLSAYLVGKIPEAEMGKQIKLWPNYATDYRPLVEYAKANRIPVVGSNAPARLVREVGKEGLAAAQSAWTGEDRRWAASVVNVPLGDEYARRFRAVIGAGHGDGKEMDTATVRRFFEAQCLRDDTMAESIARELDQNRVVLHINGGFHSDAGLGTVQRLLWQRPLLTRSMTIKAVPYRGKMAADKEKGEAQYLVYVPDTRPLSDHDK